MKKYNLTQLILIVFLVGICSLAKAQLPMSTYYLENVPQSNYLNAAFTPRANGYIGIPFASTIHTTIKSDLSTGDLFQKQGSTWLSPLNNGFDYDKLYKKMGKAANIDFHQTLAPIMFGFKAKKGYVTIGVIDKADANFAMPKAFFQMAESGLAAGTTFDLSPLNLNISYYRELSLGYSYQFSERLKVGAHAKMLFGLASVSTDIKRFNMNIEKDVWSYNLDATINGSFPVDSITYTADGFVDSLYTPEVDLNTVINEMVTNFNNPGFAVDLGAVYDLNDAWSFSIALNDLGMIKWNGNLNTFKASGDFTFEGLDIDASNLNKKDDSESNGTAGDIVDSIKNSIRYTHSSNPFTTYTTPKLIIGGKYNVNHYLSFGAMGRSTFYKDNFQQEFNLSTNFNLYHFLSASFNYNFSTRGNNSLGFGLSLRGGPLQFYLIADYVPYSYRNYVIESNNDDGTVSQNKIPGPEKLNNINMLLGMNLLFGANGFKNEPMIDAYSEY